MYRDHTMPKGHRHSRSQGYYRLSPDSTPVTSAYPPISARPTLQTQYYSNPVPVSMSHHTYQQSYSTGGPVQPLSYPTIPHPQAPALTSIRPSSGAWNPQDDATLMQARAQGMNWAPIQQNYFPSKTPNACRKRHERLMERRSADDWDGRKLEQLAKGYMSMRREIWQGLAQVTGEKWNVVEQKCMQQGLKNLQTSARSCARRERMLDTSTNNLGVSGSYQDDSGIGDDFEAEYDADGASEHSRGSNGTGGMGGGSGGYYGHQSHNSAGSSGSRMSGYGQQSRLPSIDMGIQNIINRSDINGRHEVQQHH